MHEKDISFLRLEEREGNESEFSCEIGVRCYKRIKETLWKCKIDGICENYSLPNDKAKDKKNGESPRTKTEDKSKSFQKMMLSQSKLDKDKGLKSKALSKYLLKVPNSSWKELANNGGIRLRTKSE
jgi:hypothetical protein